MGEQIRERPILLNTEMVRAILEDRKTATRRVIRPQPTTKMMDCDNAAELIAAACALYQVGDRLWVRETWYYEEHMHDMTAGEPDLPDGRYYHRYIHRATSPDWCVDVGVGRSGWRPSIHMPREAARLFLRVTGVRAERLQDITAEGCIDEGNSLGWSGAMPKPSYASLAYCEMVVKPKHIEKFAQRWDSTVKKSELNRYGWDANPWVWVIEFEREEQS